MVSLEQIKLLESKVSRTIDYVKKVTEENRQLKEKLDSYQKRIDDLEGLVLQFKQDQSRIEDGILSALDRLNQFEDALESKFTTVSKLSTEGTQPPKKPQTAESKPPEPVNAPSPPQSSEENNIEAAGGELDIF
jgi:chromosome segregation ATPase